MWKKLRKALEKKALYFRPTKARKAGGVNPGECFFLAPGMVDRM
jgi:hypothetical protein